MLRLLKNRLKNPKPEQKNRLYLENDMHAGLATDNAERPH